jgi:hypothetical protein
MITAPPLASDQERTWHGLLDLAASYGTRGWCLIGGQMVHLHCWEREAAPNRPTNDGDAVADVRGTRAGLRTLTQALVDVGFQPDRETLEGNQVRWIRGPAKIDVLVPTRTSFFTDRWTANHRPALQAPGSQQALERAEVVEVVLGGRRGEIARPSLFGAMVAKAAAFSVFADPGKNRHLEDFAVLLALAGRRDLPRSGIRRLDLVRIRTMLGQMRSARPVWIGVEGAEDGMERVAVWLRSFDRVGRER